MWIWDEHLQRLGFRRRSERYWQCVRRHGLGPEDHLSVFSWGEQAIPVGRRASRFLVELTEFHVTLARGGEFLHWYYHERHDNEWEPGGHTSDVELQRLRINARELRAEADQVAARLAGALGGVMLPRAQGRIEP